MNKEEKTKQQQLIRDRECFQWQIIDKQKQHTYKLWYIQYTFVNSYTCTHTHRIIHFKFHLDLMKTKHFFVIYLLVRFTNFVQKKNFNQFSRAWNEQTRTQPSPAQPSHNFAHSMRENREYHQVHMRWCVCVVYWIK